MRRVVHECVADGSEKKESNVLFLKVVKGALVNGSSLLIEEGGRGSFRLHPLIRQYVRFDAGRTGAGVSRYCVARCGRNCYAGAGRGDDAGDFGG